LRANVVAKGEACHEKEEAKDAHDVHGYHPGAVLGMTEGAAHVVVSRVYFFVGV
jgi:hypothetical protein